MIDIETKRKPPMTPGPGRPKGAPNKLTREVRAVLQQAFEEAGGIDQLVKWATKSDRNYGEFLRLWVRLLPLQIKVGEDGSAVRLEFLAAAKLRADEEMARYLRKKEEERSAP